MALEQLTTDQGLKMYVDHMPTAQTAYVTATVMVGSAHELPEEAGLAHVLEHAVHLQTPQFSSKPSLVRYRGVNAMKANAAAGYMRTRYYASGPDVDPIMNQLGEVVTRPIFEPPAIDSEMGVITEEARRRLGKTEWLHHFAIDNVLFGEPYGRDSIGHSDNIRFTADEVQAFYDKYYGFSNMVLVGIGNITMSQMAELAAEHFTDARTTAAVPKILPVRQPLEDHIRTGYIVDAQGAYFSRSVPLSTSLREAILADRPAFAAAENALSAHFLDTLRSGTGATFADIYLSQYNHRNAWRLSAYASASAESIPAVETCLEDVLARTPEQYSSDEVLAAIGKYKGSMLGTMDSPRGRHDEYDANIRHFGVPQNLEDEAVRIRALHEDGVRSAMQMLITHLTDTPHVTHLTGTAEAVGRVDHIVKRTDIA